MAAAKECSAHEMAALSKIQCTQTSTLNVYSNHSSLPFLYHFSFPITNDDDNKEREKYLNIDDFSCDRNSGFRANIHSSQCA